MFIVVSVNNPEPMYKQVMDQIIEAIAEGTITPGEQLPSIRTLTKELKISAITVKRAIADLEREGYIYTRSGLGCFVADKKPTQIRDEKASEIKGKLDGLIQEGLRYGLSKDDFILMVEEFEDGEQ